MEGINILINRLGKFGYRYKKGHFDIDNIPDTISNKTCYIQTAPVNDGSSELRLSSVLSTKTINEEFIIYLIDLQRNVDLNEFINDRNLVITELLKNKNDNKIEGVVKIDINNVRNGDTEKYLVSEITIAFTEIL